MCVWYVSFLCKITLNTFTGNIPMLASSSKFKSSSNVSVGGFTLLSVHIGWMCTVLWHTVYTLNSHGIKIVNLFSGGGNMQNRCWVSKPGQCIIIAGICEANPLFPGVGNEYVKGTGGSQGRQVTQAAGTSEKAGYLLACCNACAWEQWKNTLRANGSVSFCMLPLRFCSVDHHRHAKCWMSFSHIPDSLIIGKTLLF